MSPRRGTVLIVVAGISALLATLALAFLARMRDDVVSARGLLHEVQARAMLASALQYVGETARIGWGDEAYGWIDVRDGRPGPRDRDGVPLYAPGAFPDIGGVARCPMRPMLRPPCAIALTATMNPMRTDLPAGSGWDQILGNLEPDPRPAVEDRARFLAGDPRPRFADALGWFRVRRDEAAVFTLTCGCGATLGWRDWDEVVRAGGEAAFASRDDFDEARRGETILWFRAEWNPAVGANATYHYARDDASDGADFGFRVNRIGGPHQGGIDDLPNSRQFTGTFPWIMRLRQAPAEW